MVSASTKYGAKTHLDAILAVEEPVDGDGSSKVRNEGLGGARVARRPQHVERARGQSSRHLSLEGDAVFGEFDRGDHAVEGVELARKIGDEIA